MMRYHILQFALLAAFCVAVQGKKIHVPVDSNSIQGGISLSVDGDTVLVADGTYFEQINFKGKAITVASHYLIDGDTSHIRNTVIDGSESADPDSGSVVYFISGEDTTSILYGLTIRGGSGTYVFLTNDQGERLRIRAGGAELMDVSARISGNIFARDTVIAQSGVSSGGLEIFGFKTLPTAQIYDNVFYDNIARAQNSGAIGGAVTILWTDETTIANNLFEGNSATCASGEGWAQGGALCITDQEITEFGRKEVLNNRFIGNRVFSESGAYNINGGGLFIYKTTAIIGGNEVVDNLAGSSSPTSIATGGGLGIYEAGFRITNNIIADNTADDFGGGIDIQKFSNVLQKKTAATFGFGSYRSGLRSPEAKSATTNKYRPAGTAPPSVVNNTIYDNQTSFRGGGISFIDNAVVAVMNNIIWANHSDNTSQLYITQTASVELAYNNIQNGDTLTGNINADPLFVDTESFKLSDSSPCIGAGIDSIEIFGWSYVAPAYDLADNPRPIPQSSLPDMGALESSAGTPTGVDDNNASAHIPETYSLAPNVPNPFNPSTRIVYQLPRTGQVEISVYNVLGQKLATLVDAFQPAGSYEISWDASGFASGVYYYMMVTGEYRQVRKMILVR